MSPDNADTIAVTPNCNRIQEAPFPESVENVRRMLERLDADGFTDFDG